MISDDFSKCSKVSFFFQYVHPGRSKKGSKTHDVFPEFGEGRIAVLWEVRSRNTKIKNEQNVFFKKCK